ncbi:hypothetical protein HT136_21260 [Novosphingobium profundi]|uniref:hypothetical protein n=1 Tax=Novosphingobium profundi TaxID=1774954 RepID=UPI001BDA56F6|nr:hypothetical protein [Novosphingobium profundi]MBT0670902.1 hypothetical protein [Novosphingobium profundi]
MESPDTPPHIDKVDARAGTTPGIVRHVLFASLGLAIAAVAVAWVYAGSDADTSPQASASSPANPDGSAP